MLACIKRIYVTTSGLRVCIMSCGFGSHVGALQVSGLGLFRAYLSTEI